MKGADSQAITLASAAHVAGPVLPWRMASILMLATLTVIFALYQQTLLSTVAIWQRSETFAHGFLIFPISLYLIWTKRKALAEITPRPDLRGLLVMAGLGFGWLFPMPEACWSSPSTAWSP